MKIVVAERSALLCDVLTTAFADAPDVELTAVGSLTALVDRCRHSAPAVVIAGCVFGDGELADVLADILMTGARVLVICDDPSPEAASRLLFAGASGCLCTDDASPGDVVTATRAIAAGHATLHPAAAAAVLNHWRATRPAPAADPRETPPTRLSPRELQVLAALARGLPTKTIGRELAVAPKTAEAHIARLLAKLAARNRVHAVSIAIARGLLDSDAAAAATPDHRTDAPDL